MQHNHVGHVDLPRLLEGNVGLQVFDVVSKFPFFYRTEKLGGRADLLSPLAVLQGQPQENYDSPLHRTIYQANLLHNLITRSNGKLQLIGNQKQLKNYLAKRKEDSAITAAMLSIEGAHALEGDLANIDEFYRLGFRIIAPVHFFDNRIGGSTHGLRKGGLTKLGRQFVKKLENKKIIIDLAHASEKLINDIIEIGLTP